MGDSVTITSGKHAGTSSSVVDVVVRTNNRKYDTEQGRYGVPYFAYKLSNVPGTIKETMLEKFETDPEAVENALTSLHEILASLEDA